jgi:integrase
MPEAMRLTVLLAGWCGLRRGELFALTRADDSDDASTVRVSKTVTFRRGKFEAGPTKTKESNRIVTIPPHLRPITAALLAFPRRRGQGGAVVRRPGDGRVLRRGALSHKALQRPAGHRQG